MNQGFENLWYQGFKFTRIKISEYGSCKVSCNMHQDFEFSEPRFQDFEFRIFLSIEASWF
jgi:hypothetical protein